MLAPAPPVTPSDKLVIFTAAVMNSYADEKGLTVNWTTVRQPTRDTWLNAVGVAACQAHASQFSPLAREPIPNAPDPFRVMALAVADEFGRSQTRARTSAGVRRARVTAGGEAFTIWYSAICHGLEALQLAAGGPAHSGDEDLVLQLPDLREATGL